MLYLPLDTETTGLEPPIDICEISWTLMTDEFDVIEEFDSLVFCKSIPADASGVHGIRTEDVADSPKITDLPWPKDPVMLICHNTPYDRPLVEPYLNIVDELCTLRLARRLLPDAPNHQLSTLVHYLGCRTGQAHRAATDVESVIAILEFMLDATGWTMQEAADYLKKPVLVKKMPFGRHKGTNLEDLPYGYVQWMSTIELDMDMQASMKKLYPETFAKEAA